MRNASWLETVVNVLAPRACAICGCRLATDEEMICAACDLNLPRTNYAHCPMDNEMAKLFWLRLPLERAAALFHYRAASDVARVIHDMKYRNRPELGEQLGAKAAREMVEEGFFEGIELIVPMPLSKKRFKERGYNQSEWIAKGISEVTGIAVATDAVGRINFKGSQTKLQRWERVENVEHAFRQLNPQRVAGKHVLLVDDVCTTGATLTACGKQLVAAPDVKISILTIGRTQD